MIATAEEIREEIRAAFAWRPYPGDAAIALRQGGYLDADGESVDRFFRGKDWRSITLQSIIDERELDLNAFIFFLTVKGFVYYLPAFLSISLDVDGEFDLGEPLMVRLTPPPPHANDAWREQFSEIVSSLTPSEQRTVVHVLEYLAAEYEKRRYVMNQAQIALEGCWAHLTDATG